MKYYAVQVGKVPGIYNTWSECEDQVKGFKGAKFKSFASYTDAQQFLLGDTNSATNVEIPNLPFAFVDGSYNPATKVYGYGGVIKENPKSIGYLISGSGNNPELASMRNVAGELLGVLEAVRIALEKNFNSLTIFYDYYGIEKWVTGEWKTNLQQTADYKIRMLKYMRHIDIKFVKVTAHTGIPGNEDADIKAKQAVGIL